MAGSFVCGAASLSQTGHRHIGCCPRNVPASMTAKPGGFVLWIAILVIAATLAVSDGGTRAAAQGIAGMPTSFADVPRDAAVSIGNRVRAADASTLDARLPHVPLEAWLSVALARLVDPPR